METHYNERIRATILNGSDYTPLAASLQTLYDPWGQARPPHQADDDLGIVQAQITRLEIRAEQMLIHLALLDRGSPDFMKARTSAITLLSARKQLLKKRETLIRATRGEMSHVIAT
jgi:hypothetical protein